MELFEWWNRLATPADPKGDAGFVFEDQILACPAIAADAQILDIIGPPEVWRNTDIGMAIDAQDRHTNTDRCRKDLLNPREQLA